jgi:hypothetical protein
VSREAGVPTGAEVFWLAVGDLYRLVMKSEDTPTDDKLRSWLVETDRGDLGYSGILELLAPDPAPRREYLAKHFEGREPGPTHELLAELAVRGVIRVFVTPNFDRLLERALQVRGIEPIVVTSDSDLVVAPGREHARCYIVKPHGDYLQHTIRNTPSELAELPPAITTELEEIFSRYGVVVVGYSGSDEAIVRAMRGRRSHYGVYWLARGELSEPSRTLIEDLRARVIVRPGAAEFLGDLERRLAVFEAHPTGDTPITVNDEVVLMLRRGDGVGLRELLRRERRQYEDTVQAHVYGLHGGLGDAEGILAVHDALVPVFERRLASLLPLALHDAELLADEMESLAGFRSRQAPREGSQFWPELLDWCAWWLGNVVATMLVQAGRFESLSAVFAPRKPNLSRTGLEPLVMSIPGQVGHNIGTVVMKSLNDQQWYAPALEALLRLVPTMALIRERYPELAIDGKPPIRPALEFDLLQSIAMHLADERAIGHWAMYGAIADAFALRVHSDARLRKRLADAFGLDVNELVEKAADALDAAIPVGQFGNTTAVHILRTGKG